MSAAPGASCEQRSAYRQYKEAQYAKPAILLVALETLHSVLRRPYNKKEIDS